MMNRPTTSGFACHPSGELYGFLANEAITTGPTMNTQEMVRAETSFAQEDLKSFQVFSLLTRLVGDSNSGT